MDKRYVDPSEVRPFKEQFHNWMQSIYTRRNKRLWC